MIWARGLRKSFGAFEAVKGIDLDVRRGEAFGFLGPNGAGKSSTMRMIAAVSPVSGGELSILGMDPTTEGPAIRARLGVCPQEDTLDVELNVFDNLYIYGRYFGMPRDQVAQLQRQSVEPLVEPGEPFIHHGTVAVAGADLSEPLDQLCGADEQVLAG